MSDAQTRQTLVNFLKDVGATTPNVAGLNKLHQTTLAGLRKDQYDLAQKLLKDRAVIAVMVGAIGSVDAILEAKPAQAQLPAAGTGGRVIEPSVPPAQIALVVALCKKYGAKYALPPELLFAQAVVESGLRLNVGSPAGAYGLMQFTLDTAQGFAGVVGYSAQAIRTQAEPAVAAAGAYMSSLRREVQRTHVQSSPQRVASDFDTVYKIALAGYNAGPGNVYLPRRGLPVSPVGQTFESLRRPITYGELRANLRSDENRAYADLVYATARTYKQRYFS